MITHKQVYGGVLCGNPVLSYDSFSTNWKKVTCPTCLAARRHTTQSAPEPVSENLSTLKQNIWSTDGIFRMWIITADTARLFQRKQDVLDNEYFEEVLLPTHSDFRDLASALAVRTMRAEESK